MVTDNAIKDRLGLGNGKLPVCFRKVQHRPVFDVGLSGQVMQLLGKAPSNLNPHLCNICESFARSNIGGVEIRFSTLFADIRGPTSLAEHMKSAEFRKLIDRFYATATGVLSNSDAIIDILAGDQVSGYYVPGLAGPAHARTAVQAAYELLQATGHNDPQGSWIPVGVGVHTGEAFIGSVGAQGGVFTFYPHKRSLRSTKLTLSPRPPAETNRVLLSEHIPKFPGEPSLGHHRLKKINFGFQISDGL